MARHIDLHTIQSPKFRPAGAEKAGKKEMENLVETWLPDNLAAVRLTPHNEEAWQKLGISYCNSGLFDRAVESFQEALSIRSGDLAEILTNLAVVHQKMGLTELAEGYLLDALAEQPENDRILYQMAGIQSLLEKKSEAIAFLKKAVRINGSFKETARREPAFDSLKTEPGFINAVL